MEPAFLERLALCIEERFLFAGRIERTLRVPRTSLNSVRKQLFFNTLIARVTAHSVAGDIRLVITDYDLYKTSHQFVFGDASEEQRTAVVSLHRATQRILR